MFNFNETINHRHTSCVKWDTVETSYRERDLPLLWAADTDLKVYQPILGTLPQVIEQGILGCARSLYTPLSPRDATTLTR